MKRSGSLDLPSYRLVCRTVRPGSFNQRTDVADRVCSVWDQMKPHRARAIKKEWGIKWRPATKMPKEAILNFTSPPASSCIKNNQCKVLGSKWFSILAASADAEISSPPPTSFQLIKRHGPEMDTWIKPEETSPFGGFHKKWGYRKMDSWLLIWSYMIKSTKIGWFFFGDQFFWMETPICFHWKEQIFKTDDLYRASIARKRLSAVSTHLSCARFLPYWTGGFAVT